MGNKYWEDWRGGVWGGAVPSPVGGLGTCPQKKINFAPKIMQFWASFGTSFLYYSRKWGIMPPVLKVGGGPIPLSPLLRRLWSIILSFIWLQSADLHPCQWNNFCAFGPLGSSLNDDDDDDDDDDECGHCGRLFMSRLSPRRPGPRAILCLFSFVYSLSLARPYTIHFILLGHDVAYLCRECL